jgi:uncharacterized alkaline shock family protein YloU
VTFAKGGKQAIMPVQEDLGEIKINNEVVARIAHRAASEVEGIGELGGKFSFSDMLGRKDSERGVHVAIEGNRASITMEVRIQYGLNMYEVAYRLQKTVKDTVEQTTGLIVDKVNVTIKDIAIPEPEKREKSERNR